MSKKLEKLYKEYKKSQGYADGGDVSDDSPLEQAQHNVRLDFGTPSNPPPHVLTRDERNALIRQQNTSNASGKTSVLDQHIYNPGNTSDGHFKGGKIKGYADGTDPSPIQPDDTLSQTISRQHPELSDEDVAKVVDKVNENAAILKTQKGMQQNPLGQLSPSEMNTFQQSRGNDNLGTNPLDQMKKDIVNNPDIGKMVAPIPSAASKSVKEAGMSKGGKVKKEAPHNKKNLEELKKSFAKFINEEEIQKYNKGGKVKGYADGTDPLPVQPDDSEEDNQDNADDSIASQYNITTGGQKPEGYTSEDLNDIKTADANPDMVTDLSEQGIDLPSDIGLPKEEEKALNKVEEEKALSDKDKKLTKKSDEEPTKENDSDEESPEEDTDESTEEPSDQKDSQDQPASDQTPDDQSSYSRLLASLNPNKLGSSDALANAQAQRQNMIASNKDLQLGNLIGAGIAGRGGARVSPLPQSFFDSMDKGANLPVQNIEEQIANQENDPNSDYSKSFAKAAADTMGIDPSKLKGMSAKALKAIVPLKVQQMAHEIAISKLVETKKYHNDTASYRGKMADINQQKANAMRINAEGNKDAKVQAAQDRTLQQTKMILEANRGSKSVQQAESDLQNAQKFNSLYNLYGDPNKLSTKLAPLGTMEIAKMGLGGIPQGHEIDALQPGSLAFKAQDAWSKIGNNPTPAKMGAYLKEYKDYADALTKDAQNVIQEKYGRVIESSKKQLGPDNYQALQDSYINRFKPKEAQLSDDDRAASKHYLEMNLNDPKRAQLEAVLRSKGLIQ